jgi:hypothetical protein
MHKTSYLSIHVNYSILTLINSKHKLKIKNLIINLKFKKWITILKSPKITNTEKSN